MYLSRYNTRPEIGPDASLLAKIVHFLRKSALWIGGVVFATLAALGTFFFAMAAIIGAFILAGAIAFAWFLFKMLGPKNISAKDFTNDDNPQTLNATRGPKGWTVNRKNPFGE